MTELEKEFAWLQRETLAIQYGSVALTVTVHNGRVTRTERTTTIKQQLDIKKESK